MTVEEIFTKLATHMAQGISYHEEMAKAYDFIGLWGFAQCHTYHQFEEMHNYRRMYHYYATHYFKLIQLDNIEKVDIIPSTWYKYSTQAVDNGTKKSAVRDLMNKWVEWERSTKKLYQEMQKELVELKEMDAARKIEEYVHEVSTELHNAEKQLIALETISYDLVEINDQSNKLKKEYKKKLGW